MNRTSSSGDVASFPYEEPGIVTILIQSSLLLLLNGVDFVLDRLIYCGLLGQIFLGVAWGTPGGKWLNESAEQTISQLGYLGLILLVYEGGLNTSLSSLRANLAISVCVALTGIIVPIGLSFVLLGLVHASPLEAFAAGAALCSTSLGTTFTILSSSGLSRTRLGVVLTTAAMLDDVIGLVMVQVISNLGKSRPFKPSTVIRPVFVSIGFVILLPLCCAIAVRPVTKLIIKYWSSHPKSLVHRPLSIKALTFATHTLILIAAVAAGSYGGTSNLFTAYLAGLSISWWDSEYEILQNNATREQASAKAHDSASKSAKQMPNMKGPQPPSVKSAHLLPTHSGREIYSQYLEQPVAKILKPLFFSSIGFSIPISEMFQSRIIWRGIIYSILMLIGKIICGCWLIRFKVNIKLPSSHRIRNMRILGAGGSGKAEVKPDKPTVSIEGVSKHGEDETVQRRAKTPSQSGTDIQGLRKAEGNTGSDDLLSPAKTRATSIYPASILGCAMVARGEIGFLISSLAQSQGIFTSGPGGSEIFLVVTWAIMLCTIFGPLAVGLLTRRVRFLERKRTKTECEGFSNVLGDWGID